MWTVWRWLEMDGNWHFHVSFTSRWMIWLAIHNFIGLFSMHESTRLNHAVALSEESSQHEARGIDMSKKMWRGVFWGRKVCIDRSGAEYVLNKLCKIVGLETIISDLTTPRDVFGILVFLRLKIWSSLHQHLQWPRRLWEAPVQEVERDPEDCSDLRGHATLHSTVVNSCKIHYQFPVFCTQIMFHILYHETLFVVLSMPSHSPPGGHGQCENTGWAQIWSNQETLEM